MAAPAQALMKKRWLLNVTLLLLVAVLAATAFYQSGRAPEDDRPALTGIDGRTVARIELERARTPPLTLERDGGGWRLIRPLAARANGFNVETLLSIARAPSEAQLAVDPEALKQYGLEPAHVLLRLGNETIGFGSTHPLKPQHYVRYRDTVHLIASRYFAHVTAPYTSLLDTRLIEDGRRPIAFRLPGFSLTLNAGSWQRSPDDNSISGDRINDFVEEWRHARALSVERYSGRAVLDRIRITFDSPEPQRRSLTLGILARQPDLVLYRQDEGLEYHFPEETGKRLLALTADASRS